jgi:hypothetical protein
VAQEPLNVTFDPTAPYELDTSKIPKPEVLKPIFVDENFKEVPIDQAKFIILSTEEYAKIAALLKYAKAYKDISKEQEHLINIYIEMINSLKELVALEQAKAAKYREMWADSENAYRQERYAHRLDNAVNKGILGLISIGSIVALILAL